MLNILKTLFLIAILSALVLFSLHNGQKTEINIPLLEESAIQTRLYIIIYISLFAGCILGYLTRSAYRKNKKKFIDERDKVTLLQGKVDIYETELNIRNQIKYNTHQNT